MSMQHAALTSHGAVSSSDPATDLQRRINRSIVARAKLSLATIVGGSPLQDRTANIKRSSADGRSESGTVSGRRQFASATAPGVASAPEEDEPGALASDPGASADGFRRSLRDAFMSVFASDLKDKCGVAVEEIALQDLRFTDQELAVAMARGALARTELTQADIDREVIVTKAESE